MNRLDCEAALANEGATDIVCTFSPRTGVVTCEANLNGAPITREFQIIEPNISIRAPQPQEPTL